ncbi:MAG: hypothetical protein HYU68_14780 [Bacteroidetes bacterium]|nr:hypothetical protein [Bacteroidota bacterium]
MKNIFYKSILLVIISLSSTHLFSQAFEKGNINFDLGLGFGAYGTKVTYKDTKNNFEVSKTDGAASTIIPLSFEYGLSNKIGLGLQIGSSNYFIENKDSNDVTESVKSIDFALRVNFHLLQAERNDLFIALALGGSSVNWTFKNTTETYSGSGAYFGLSLVDRIFFGEHVGIMFNLGYTGYNYNNMKTSSGNPILDNLTWSVKGVNFGTGLAVKF